MRKFVPSILDTAFTLLHINTLMNWDNSNQPFTVILDSPLFYHGY